MRRTEPVRQYGVHKIFGPTIQGEGGMTGSVSHFLRLSGCNMWDGRPETRADSQCPFCDTDFFSHTMLDAGQIRDSLVALGRVDWVTISGGEPSMQVDQNLVDCIQNEGFKVAIETNGTRPLNAQVDYVTMSPKLSEPEIVVRRCDSLKVLWPHPNPAITPEAFVSIDAETRYLQPIETGNSGRDRDNILSTIAKLYTLRGWRISLQTHKMIGVE